MDESEYIVFLRSKFTLNVCNTPAFLQLLKTFWKSLWFFFFPPYYRDTKSECFLFFFRSLPQILYTNTTHLLWSPWHILISQLHKKLCTLHFLNEARNVSLMVFNHELATNMTKPVWRVHTTMTWHVQRTTQYKIKFRLKNERALTASLEHDVVLSHSHLDLKVIIYSNWMYTF
jgi:hypothetical protein